MNVANDREFTVVLRGPSAALLRPDEEVCVRNVGSTIGQADVVWRSRWVPHGDAVTLPGHLCTEVVGRGASLETSLVPFANAGLAVLPILSLSANAAVLDPDIELGFDSTPGVEERDYFQSYLPPEGGDVHFVRHIDGAATASLVDAIGRHPDVDRLMRAASQYRLALNFWELGRETPSLAHLWMALEALTKAVVRAEYKTRGVCSEQELAGSLGVKLETLYATVRRELILNGDGECYAKAKEASDGLEHGFLDYRDVIALARDARDRMAGHIRRAILNLCDLRNEVLNLLVSERFDRPLGYWRPARYLRGRLLGGGSELPAQGKWYPYVRWAYTVEKAVMREDGGLDLQFNEHCDPEVGDGIRFQCASLQVWKPD